MKKLSVLAILVLAITIFLIPSMCFADAAGSYHLVSAYVTMTEPDYGSTVPMDLDAGKKINVSNIVWKDPNGKVLTSTSRIVEAGKYTLTFDLDRVGGDRFAASTYVFINQKAAGNKTCINGDKISVTNVYDIVANKRLSNASGKGQYLYEENYKPVSTIKATINSPKKGEKLDYDPKMTETEGAIVRGVVWNRYNPTTEKWDEITDKDYLAEEAVEYTASILFNFSDGFKLDPDTKTGWVNTWNVCEVTNLNGNCCITSLSFFIRPTNSSAGSRPSTSTTTTETTSTPTRPTTGSTVATSTEKLSLIEVTVDDLKVGYELPKTFKVKTNLTDEKSFEIGKEGVAFGEWDSDKNIEANKEYTFSVKVKAGAVSETSDFKAKINGNEVTFERFGSRTNIEYRFSYTFKAPNEKATGFEPSLKPSTSGEKVTSGDVKTEAKSGDAVVETKSGDNKTETKPEETKTETKPEEKVETIVWTEASNWAIEELNKANEAGLIPTIFNKQSLKKNITRKEFAYVAVKLYEKLTGKKAEAIEKNPFKDTKDEEVLKAFKLEITNGISETEFAPDNEITREQMATMMARALKAAGIDVSVDLANVKEFADDKEMHNWSRSAIYFMSNIEIIKGVGDNKFDVNGTATREQALLVSYRSANKFAK